jgi:ATP-dependent DNA helicase RecQ
MTGGERCRRRQILDHFGDAEECGASGRCCDVCNPDSALEQAMEKPGVGKATRKRGGRAEAGRAGAGGPLTGTVGYAGAAGSSGAYQAIEANPVDEGEFERLRTWRWERAEGKPAFTVAANTVLEDVLRTRPSSLEELIAIRGIGPAFCEKHGESLLGALAALKDGAAPASEAPVAVGR